MALPSYGTPHVNRGAKADWVERESQPEYRVTANFTDEYRHRLVLTTVSASGKTRARDGWWRLPAA